MLDITIANKHKQHNATRALLNYKQLDVKTHTRTTHKTKHMRITDLTKKKKKKKTGVTQVLPKDKQFMLLIRHSHVTHSQARLKS